MQRPVDGSVFHFSLSLFASMLTSQCKCSKSQFNAHNRTCSLIKCSLLLFIFSISFFWSVLGFAEWQSDSQGIMGTEVSVTLWHNKADVARMAINEVMEDMEGINQRLSPYIKTSELSKINAQAAERTQVLTNELFFLIDKSLYFSRISEGAFDITFASLGARYDYREKKQPSPKERKNLLPAINYKWLELNKKAKTLKFLHPNVQLDLGGIAKGYAVDRAINIIKKHGVKHASVSAGGDSRVIGLRNGYPWMIGIKNPRLDSVLDHKNSYLSAKNNAGRQQQSVIRLPLSDSAVSTSGDYERFFIDEVSGERVHHILNPATGKSAKKVVSVTVIGDKGVDTDPLSTTVFVLGVERGLSLVNQIPGFDAIIIDSQGEVHYSKDLVDPKNVN